jgi:hypothetical protein
MAISLSVDIPSFFGIATSNNNMSGFVLLNFSNASIPSMASATTSCRPILSASLKTT